MQILEHLSQHKTKTKLITFSTFPTLCATRLLVNFAMLEASDSTACETFSWTHALASSFSNVQYNNPTAN